MNSSERDRSIIDVRVRLAALEDYAGFEAVAGETHAHHVAAIHSVFRSVAVAVPREYFAQLVTGDDSDVIVAEVSGKIVGYAVLLHRRAARDMLVPRAYAHIENFGVAAAYRREGIGRRLIEACAARAKERGATSLELDCWEANQGAIAFYTSLGMLVTRRYFAMDI